MLSNIPAIICVIINVQISCIGKCSLVGTWHIYGYGRALTIHLFSIHKAWHTTFLLLSHTDASNDMITDVECLTLHIQHHVNCHHEFLNPPACHHLSFFSTFLQHEQNVYSSFILSLCIITWAHSSTSHVFPVYFFSSSSFSSHKWHHSPPKMSLVSMLKEPWNFERTSIIIFLSNHTTFFSSFFKQYFIPVRFGFWG